MMCPGAISVQVHKPEVGPYNAVEFVLGHFTDIHNGSLCAELIPVNMSWQSSSADLRAVSCPSSLQRRGSRLQRTSCRQKSFHLAL